MREAIRKLEAAVLSNPGDTSEEQRRAIAARVAALSGKGGEAGKLEPPELDAYICKVALHAYRIVDEDMARLARAGFSGDAIYELTVVAAMVAGSTRAEIGLNALEGSR
jgi:alkylhydroperoxidase family enzyme